MTSSDTSKGAPRGLTSLKSMQVDLTSRMGALTKATATGVTQLDRMLTGGLRKGTVLSIGGAAGSGRSSLALFIAYMCARARTPVLVVSASLDETEIMARFAARALHREWLGSNTPYPAIWSGEAWQRDVVRGPVGQAVDTVANKVGQYLYLHRASAFESTEELSKLLEWLWSRNEMVVLVVDDVEALSAGNQEHPAYRIVNASYDNRLSQVALELASLAQRGAAIVCTVQAEHQYLVTPAATLALELRRRSDEAGMSALQPRSVELVVTKNRLGDTGVIPLSFIPGAAVFEEPGGAKGQAPNG